MRVRQTLEGLAFYIALSGLLGAAALCGLIDATATAVLTAVLLSASLGVCAFVRSGLNLRLPLDRELSVAQGLWCVAAACAAYAVAGPLRGAMLAVLPAAMLLGVFCLTPLQARCLGLIAVLALAGTLGTCALAWPGQFPPAQEALHFVLATVLIGASVWAAVRLTEFGESLRLARQKLDDAVAQSRLLITQDELTGLSNRRHMMSLIVIERARQQRHRDPISVVVLDIDFFKRINESWGQPSGDEVLQIFADVVIHAMRAGDALARWGGEEFLLMLPETAADSALMCVERIRKQLASRSFEHIGRDIQVTFSAGISECTVGDRMELAIERADRAMHKAKTQGRNRSALA